MNIYIYIYILYTRLIHYEHIYIYVILMNIQMFSGATTSSHCPGMRGMGTGHGGAPLGVHQWKDFDWDIEGHNE